MSIRPRSAAFLLIVAALSAEPAPRPLWPQGAPGALGQAEKDTPTLTVYLPEPAAATGAAIVVCPGGGYNVLVEHEGAHYARWFNAHGIAAFVLKYRLSSDGYRHPAMLDDAARAVRYVRAHATEWNIDPRRVGIIGSSAGGHLASTLLTHFTAGDPQSADPVERESSRPDLGILCYAAVAMTGPFAYPDAILKLLGPAPDTALVASLSNDQQVTAGTPPCFVWHTVEDKVVPVEHSLLFAQALRRAGVPFDLHIYEKGVHGIGLGDQPPFPNPHPWAADCLFWLKQRGFAR